MTEKVPACPQCGRQLVYQPPGPGDQLHIGALYACPGSCGYSVLLPSIIDAAEGADHAEPAEPTEAITPHYYPINEDAARQDHVNHHMSDYQPGTATASYRAAVDAFTAKCNAAKATARPGHEKQLDALADRYARRLAENLNAQYSAGSRHVSWFISGPAGYPMNKHRKYEARMDTLFAEYEQIQKMTADIGRAAGDPSIILSGDPEAIDQLTDKLRRLEAAHVVMKNANDYWRKHGTLDGCPDLTPEIAREANPFRGAKSAPFSGWPLQYNLANIKRTRERLEQLKAAKAATPAAVTVEATDDEHPGYTYKENTDAMRVQFIFDDKPDATTRDLLKQNGFRWAPSQNAWQRQLTPNGKRAASAVMAALKANA